MVKRAPKWQERMRMNLELKLVSVSPQTRGRSIPLFFTSEASRSRWLERAAQTGVMTGSRKSRIQ